MDNLEKIAELFSTGDMALAGRLAQRITDNFSIEDDEFFFEIDCQVYQPNRATGERLIAEGKAELIANNPCDARSVLNKQSVKCRVIVTDRTAKNSIAGNSFSISLDSNGIKSVVASSVHRTSEAKEIIECWLVRDFGKVMIW